MNLKRKFKIWCLLREQFSHVKPVEEVMQHQAEFIYDANWEPEIILEKQPDLVICVNDFPYEIVRCLDTCRQIFIPSLVLQDGILEWRCQYENTLLGAGGGAPQHQPVMADKIACIGNQSARQIASWGNQNKVEVTGMPKLDILIEKSKSNIPQVSGNVLIMTARTPWFNLNEKDIVIRSLIDLKEFFNNNSRFKPIWRLTQNLNYIINVNNELNEIGTLELHDILLKSEAVITTPSTAILEAMLLNKPVAALDYNNVPRFVQTAWTISAPDHIPIIVNELVNPSFKKMIFQHDILKDCLRCERPASPNVAELIVKMIKIAEECKQRKLPLNFRSHLLDYKELIHNYSAPPLSKLYPDQQVFLETDIQALQVRIARLNKENEKLIKEIKKRKIGDILAAIRRFISQKIEIARYKKHLPS